MTYAILTLSESAVEHITGSLLAPQQPGACTYRSAWMPHRYTDAGLIHLFYQIFIQLSLSFCAGNCNYTVKLFQMLKRSPKGVSLPCTLFLILNHQNEELNLRFNGTVDYIVKFSLPLQP